MTSSALHIATAPNLRNLVGEGTVYHSENKEHRPLYITQENVQNGTHIFSAYVSHADGYQWAGEMKVDWLRTLPTGDFGCEDRPNEYGACTRYGKKGTDLHVSKVFIDTMNSFERETLKGVGTALMQVAVEHSMNLGCAGRIILVAAWNSHGFWYKKGMRALSNKTIECTDGVIRTDDERVILELEAAKSEHRKPKTKELNVILLYLPSSKISRWQDIIAASPILIK